MHAVMHFIVLIFMIHNFVEYRVWRIASNLQTVVYRKLSNNICLYNLQLPAIFAWSLHCRICSQGIPFELYLEWICIFTLCKAGHNWFGRHRSKFDEDFPYLCRFCNNAREDPEHLWSSCRIFNGVRHSIRQLCKDDKSSVSFDKPFAWSVTQ